MRLLQEIASEVVFLSRRLARPGVVPDVPQQVRQDLSLARARSLPWSVCAGDARECGLRGKYLSLGLCVLVTEGSVGLGRLRERDREKNKARQSVARLSSIQPDTPADPNTSTLPPTACVGGGRGATRLAPVAAVGSQRVNSLCITTDASASTSSHATADTHLEGKESERQNEPTKTCDNCRKLLPYAAVF